MLDTQLFFSDSFEPPSFDARKYLPVCFLRFRPILALSLISFGVHATFSPVIWGQSFIPLPPEALSEESVSPDGLPHWRSMRACGATCIYALLYLSEKPVPFEEVVTSVSIGEDGSTLAELVEGAKKLGLNLIARKAATDSLSSIKVPFISHVEHIQDDGISRGHYVVVLGKSSDRFTILDPASYPWVTSVSESDFVSMFTGYIVCSPPEPLSDWKLWAGISFLQLAIILIVLRHKRVDCEVSNRPDHTQENVFSVLLMVLLFGCAGCDTQTPVARPVAHENLPQNRNVAMVDFEQRIIGWVKKDRDSALAEFDLINISKHPITIDVGPTSCTCASVETFSDLVAAGENTDVSLTINREGRVGKVDAQAILLINNKQQTIRLGASVLLEGIETPVDVPVVLEDRPAVLNGQFAISSDISPELSVHIPSVALKEVFSSTIEITEQTVVDNGLIGNYAVTITCENPKSPGLESGSKHFNVEYRIGHLDGTAALLYRAC